MFWRSRIRWYTREWAAAAIFLALVVAGAAIYRSQWRPSSYRLVISAGSVNGLRHRFAERLAEDAAARGLGLRIVGTRGSLEASSLVDSGELDLALVQGGLDPGAYPNVRQVAALHVEPMHLLVREEIATGDRQPVGSEGDAGRISVPWAAGPTTSRSTSSASRGWYPGPRTVKATTSPRPSVTTSSRTRSAPTGGRTPSSPSRPSRRPSYAP